MKLLQLLEIINDEDRRIFSCGSCMLLAWTLHKKLGWDMVGVGVDFQEDGYPDDIFHVWVENRGVAIDIYGVTTIPEMHQRWLSEEITDDAAIFDFEPWFIKGFLDDYNWGPDPKTRRAVWRRAVQIVRWLQQEHSDLLEDDKIDLPDLEVGDELMVGKFKNRNATIKGFKKDKHNQPVAKTDKGDQQIFKGRIKKLMSSASESRLDELFDSSLSDVEVIDDEPGRSVSYNVDGIEWLAMLQGRNFAVTTRNAPETMRQALKGFGFAFKWIENAIRSGHITNPIILIPFDEKRERIFKPLIKRMIDNTGWNLETMPALGSTGYRISPPGQIHEARNKSWTYKNITPKVIADIKKIVKKVHDDEGCDVTNPDEVAHCWIVAEILQHKYGWGGHSGIYLSRSGEPIGDHVWNVLDDGTIIDSTPLQWHEGYDIRIVPPNDPEHQRYRYEWNQDYNPTIDYYQAQPTDDKWTGEYDMDAITRLRKERGPKWWVRKDGMNESGQVSSQAAAKYIAADEELFDAISGYVYQQDHFREEGADQLPRFLDILRRVRPMKKRLYRGEPSYEYNNWQPDPDHEAAMGFSSWSANVKTAQMHNQYTRNAMVKYTDGPFQAIALSDIVYWRNRLFPDEGHYGGSQAEYFVLEPVIRRPAFELEERGDTDYIEQSRVR